MLRDDFPLLHHEATQSYVISRYEDVERAFKDPVADFATRFPVNVIADMLGLDRADHGRFHRWYTAIIGFLGNLAQDPDVAEAGLLTRDEFAAYLLASAAPPRARPRPSGDGTGSGSGRARTACPGSDRMR